MSSWLTVLWSSAVLIDFFTWLHLSISAIGVLKFPTMDSSIFLAVL